MYCQNCVCLSQVVINENNLILLEFKQRIIGLNNILFHINDVHEYINYNSIIRLNIVMISNHLCNN